MGKWESENGAGNIHIQVSRRLHTLTLKKGGRKGKTKQIPYLLSKAFKMLGQLTREVGVFKSVLEACFKGMHSHSAGKVLH